MAKPPLRVLFGDLRHRTTGVHSVHMPLALGFIAGYARTRIGHDNIDVRIETRPERAFALIDEGWPQAIALSHYCWNSELSNFVFRYAKRHVPDVTCIAGGPHFPLAAAHCREFLAARPHIDFYVHQEGEQPFADLLSRLWSGDEPERLKAEPIPGVMSLHPGSGDLSYGGAVARLTSLDVIPSPYLSGLFDKFFDGRYFPFIESARGCPYACTFCEAAATWYNKVVGFSIERVAADLDYIAARAHHYPHLALAIADSNFGMLKRDEEIAAHINTIQAKYGWPTAFDVSTGKAQLDRAITVAQRLDNKLMLSLSVQSLNGETLRAIKRKNLADDRIIEISGLLRRLGIKSYSDLVLPLPNETKDSFLAGMRTMSRTSVDVFIPFTTMMLPGTDIAQPETRETFGLQTMFRLLPRQFGEYRGEKIFEIEEVCIATNTMSFDDYLECRGMAFLMKLFSDRQFDTLKRHCMEVDIEFMELIERVLERFTDDPSNSLASIYRRFIQANRDELFSTAEGARAAYRAPETYQRLIRGDAGENLMRRFVAEVILDAGAAAHRCAYDVLLEIMREREVEFTMCAAVADAARWIERTRDIRRVLESAGRAADPVRMLLDFNVDSWYHTKDMSRKLTAFRARGVYDAEMDWRTVNGLIDRSRETFGGDIYYWAQKMLEQHPVEQFWLRTVSATAHDSSSAGGTK